MKYLSVLCTLLLLTPTAGAYQLGELEMLSEPGEPLVANMRVDHLNLDGLSTFVMQGKSDFCPAIDYTPIRDEAGRTIFRVTSVKPANDGHRMVMKTLYRNEAHVRLYTLSFPVPSRDHSVETLPMQVFDATTKMNIKNKRPLAKGEVIAPSHYRVSRGDTAGVIAAKYKDWIGGDLWDRIWAIVEQNPHAFPGGDPNFVIAGEVLVIR